MDRYSFSKSLTEKLPGTWKPTTDGSALVTCPGCGTTLRLQHTIEANGDINPSLDCPVCDFHEWAHLNDWQPNEVSNGM